MNKYTVLFIMLFNTNVLKSETINQQWLAAFSKHDLQPASLLELQQVEHAFTQELQGIQSELWTKLDMQRLEQSNRVTFQESEQAQQGRGLFMLNVGARMHHVLIQAPHAKADRYTGELAALLFEQGALRAAQWNSVPRYAEMKGFSAKADMAHLSQTYWQVFTQAFAQQFAHARIIQLHGYERSKRKSKQGKDSEMIVSAGHYNPPAWVQKTAHCLKQKMPGKVSLFPYDVNELGATTNSQGQLLQGLNHQGFLHIEMSLSLRKSLLDSAELRQLLLDCLQDSDD
ncbi:MAG: hypothetical protein K9L22_03100 [Methylococcaceae bacterium]|nr:hypothetical protein [Methylococcaceae bacterium]